MHRLRAPFVFRRGLRTDLKKELVMSSNLRVLLIFLKEIVNYNPNVSFMLYSQNLADAVLCISSLAFDSGNHLILH